MVLELIFVCMQQQNHPTFLDILIFNFIIMARFSLRFFNNKSMENLKLGFHEVFELF